MLKFNVSSLRWNRWVTAVLLLHLVVISVQSAFASGTTLATSNSGIYTSQKATITVPNYSIGNGTVNAGVYMYTAPTAFMQSGVIQNCVNSTCVYHPFAGWQKAGGVADVVISTVNVTPGQAYTFQVSNYGGNNWTATYCSAQCSAIKSLDLGVSSFSYASDFVTTTDANSLQKAYYNVKTTSNQLTKNNAMQNWCYTTTSSTDSGTWISSCSSNGWTFQRLPTPVLAGSKQ